MNLDVRSDFPILNQKYNGHDLVYFDNGASSQRPNQVIDAMSEYYQTAHSNIHRGVHFLGERATQAYEHARHTVTEFIHAVKDQEIIFCKNVTEAINLVAHSYVAENLSEGDVIVTSKMEHHSNLVPWLQLSEKKGIKIQYLNLTDDGKLVTDDIETIFADSRVKFFAITHVSNVLGTVNDVRALCSLARKHGVTTLVDAAQSVPHMSIDVQDIGCDFLAFTGHKMCGPTGIGVLYGRYELLDSMPPFLGGGGMIDRVYTDHFTAAEVPERFEAGTPPIAEAVGLAAAINYLKKIGLDAIAAHEKKLSGKILSEFEALDYVTVFGPQFAHDRIGVVSFAVEGVHPHDVSEILSNEAVCVRAGHHCAQTLMDFLHVPATTRASTYFYNTEAEVDRFVEAVKKSYTIFNS